MPHAIAESRPLSEASTGGTTSTGRLRLQVITPGWGSSGYYSPEVLEAAGRNGVFPAGTQSYLDHPSYSEAMDRPERSIRDLAGVFTEAAHWDEQTQALVAEVQVFGPFRDLLTEMRDAIGVSIRASGQAEAGEAEGREGVIITELSEGKSVDFVTTAGRGGRILQVLESARPTLVNERAVAHGITEATANDTREALQAALRERFTGDRTYVYVRDFDETTVWYELSTPDTEALFQLTYTLPDNGGVTLTGDPVEVRARTTYVPVSPAGSTNPIESHEGGTMPTIEEARLRQLEEAAGRVITLEAERNAAVERADTAEAERDTVKRKLAEQSAREAARPIAAQIVAESKMDLPPLARSRLVEGAVRAAALTPEGWLDEAALRTQVLDARTQAEAELAEALVAAGVGQVRGHGDTGSGEVSEADFERAVAAAFGRQMIREG